MENKERKVQEWWDSLPYMEKIEVISDTYPDEYIYDMDSMWEALDWKIQLQIYKEWNE